MELADRQRFMAKFSLAWPAPEIDLHRTALWDRDLEPLDGALAFAALDALRVDSEYQPSLAKFLEQYRALRRAAELRTPALPADAGRPAQPEQWRRFLEQARQVARADYPHDHRHGWQQCPTCGKGAA